MILSFLRSHLLFSVLTLFSLGSLIFGIILFRSPSTAEWYYNSVFLPLNRNWQKILQFSDVPYYLVLIGIVFILLVGQWMMARGQGWKYALLSWGLFILSGTFFLIALFYWMWGFNYGRETLSRTFFDDEFVAVDSQKFVDRWQLQTSRVNHLRRNLVVPDSADQNLTPTYGRLFRKNAERILDPFGLDASVAPRCKEFIPAGGLLRINTAGFYFPYGSESYVDKALHVSQKPFVIAHELAHGYGVADEGEANFVGYLLCQNSGDRYAQYSSALSLWLYMAVDGRRLEKDFVKKMWDGLSPEVWGDLQERRKLDAKYPELFPRLRDRIYDSYLAMNRVEGGIHSYNRFVQMVLTYEDRK